ncbi:MAG: hypothetical protein JWM68_3633 [Verrucomicrobiales bacterium]|nr:hypothetical protein [Verrucomicrobiales bacterium]
MKQQERIATTQRRREQVLLEKLTQANTVCLRIEQLSRNARVGIVSDNREIILNSINQIESLSQILRKDLA